MQSSGTRPAVEHPTGKLDDELAAQVLSLRAPASLRQTLRAATAESHARLHLHEGFAAIQSGTIDLVDYRSLLVRLYGFHVAFEAAMGMACERSVWLRDDLAALGVGDLGAAEIPRCTALASLDRPGHVSPGRRLGAVYVVEGSTLGGRHLARKVEPLLTSTFPGSAGSAGRRFLLGRGADTDAAWNAFLARLTSSAITPAVHSEIVAAAVTTFGIFEEWMRDWRDFEE